MQGVKLCKLEQGGVAVPPTECGQEARNGEVCTGTKFDRVEMEDVYTPFQEIRVRALTGPTYVCLQLIHAAFTSIPAFLYYMHNQHLGLPMTTGAGEDAVPGYGRCAIDSGGGAAA